MQLIRFFFLFCFTLDAVAPIVVLECSQRALVKYLHNNQLIIDVESYRKTSKLG